ncbi:MAG: hypothetical protein CVV23_17430 [Ignavibacteriae bacterium HGW-Ignavibacteriae-2]|jgi:hypothetical protein|nr:MAG: hypothetical protein CVV23_17430 [Ignavibacteriae bacterium HGW-Ignavibacteriae-2]
MKKLYFSLILIGFIFSSCSDNSSIVSSESSQVINSKSVVNSGEISNWLSLPELKEESLRKVYSAKKRIMNSEGGYLEFNEIYETKNGKTINIYSSLTFPPNFIDTDDDDSNDFADISMTADTRTCSYTFTPHMKFNNKPIFNGRYEGLNLAGINTDKLQFVFQSDAGDLEFIRFEKITVDTENGVLEIQNAIIPHFCRYGFVN